MGRNYRTRQQKYEYVALHWGKLSTRDIARNVHIPMQTLHVIVLRMRKKGVPILHIPTTPRRRKARGEGIDYKKIKELLENT